MQQGSVVLGYWAIRGLAQRIRMVLQFLQIPYTQERYQGQQGRNKWFSQVKPKLIQKNPAITLPYLIDGDKVITQSQAIVIYLCYKGGKPELLGRDANEKVSLATAYGVYKDFHPNYIRMVYGTYTAQRTFQNAQKQSFEIFQPFLKKLSGLLGQREYYCGQITWIDFALGDFYQTLDLLDTKYLDKFINLRSHHQRIWKLPQLQKYFSSQRYRQRPCNNYTATWK